MSTEQREAEEAVAKELGFRCAEVTGDCVPVMFFPDGGSKIVPPEMVVLFAAAVRRELKLRAHERGEWISVEDRLPAEPQHYLCIMADEPDMGRRIEIVFFNSVAEMTPSGKPSWGEPFLYPWATHEVRYWKPFPKLPPEEGKT